MSEHFTYNASALGVGGVFQRNDKRTVIPSLASVALAPTGGEGYACETNYSYDGISFDRAESRVVGFDDGNGVYTTYSDVFITGLNVFDRLQIGLMHATVESRHDTKQPDAESEFKLRAVYRGIDIDGHEVLPQLDGDLMSDRCETYSKFEQHLRGKSQWYAQQFGIEETQLIDVLQKSPKPQLRTSLLEKLDVRPLRNDKGEGIGRRKGYALPVPRLGKVHFAEYLVKPGRRRITLLRIDLNSLQRFVPMTEQTDETGGELLVAEPMMLVSAQSKQTEFDGTLSLASVEGNGSPPWKP